MLYEDKNIWAKVICDSYSVESGGRMTTFEIQLPRFILAELNTHGLLKKCTQSSRAVPVKAMLDLYEDNFYVPQAFGVNQAGMSSSKYLEGYDALEAESLWRSTETAVRYYVETLGNKEGLNLHKQWASRLYEPFMYTKLVITATEWDNFFWLRDDEDAAQPEMVDLTRKMKVARENSIPQPLSAGEWHMPYVKQEFYFEDAADPYGVQVFKDANGEQIDVETALMISASCCAQTSYRKADDSLEKAKIVYDKLFGGSKPHYSPTEQQGRVMKKSKAGIIERVFPSKLEEGVSHMDREGNLWSANLKGFVQYRKILEQRNK